LPKNHHVRHHDKGIRAGYGHFFRLGIVDSRTESLPVQQELFNLNRLATYFRLPRDWLKAEAIAGRIPCLKIGRKFFFNVKAVEAALAERAATAFVEPEPVTR